MVKVILDLIKVRILVASLLTMFIGYLLALKQGNLFQWDHFLFLNVGVVFVFSGAAALNHLLEKESDKLMDRTKDRPLPSNRTSVRFVLIFSIITSIIGALILFYKINNKKI